MKLSIDAQENLEEVGMTAEDVAEDVRRMRDGEVTYDKLLGQCLNGAENDRVNGWYAYVDAVKLEAGV